MKQARSSHVLYFQRWLANMFAMVASCIAAILGLFFLGWILWTLVHRGVQSINLDLFTRITPPPMQSGGLSNAFFGSALMCGLAIVIGAPIGIAAGTWLAEYSNASRLGAVLRFVNDVLLSAPSIVLGLFIYTLYIMHTGGHFSAFAGSLSLVLVVIPIVIRTTDEMLRLVPSQMREAALSLGIPQWKVTIQIIFRCVSKGILTGVLLAAARISGETAPLIFTAFGNQYWSTQLFQPIAAVPLAMNQFAASPYATWKSLAWAGALVLTLFVLFLSVVARLLLQRFKVS